MGVGAGEAGAVPPAQSLIADYYPPKERAGALGFYMMSSMAGHIIGMVVGGWAAPYYGWRAAFLLAGLPGFLLALPTKFLLPQPRLPGGCARTPEQTENARRRHRVAVLKLTSTTNRYPLPL